MEKIDQIETDLREGNLSQAPSICADYVASLSGELSFYLSKVGELELKRDKNWQELREKHKSDTSAERAWGKTNDGIEYNWYNTRIKRITALIRGLREIIKRAETESRNQF